MCVYCCSVQSDRKKAPSVFVFGEMLVKDYCYTRAVKENDTLKSRFEIPETVWVQALGWCAGVQAEWFFGIVQIINNDKMSDPFGSAWNPKFYRNITEHGPNY